MAEKAKRQFVLDYQLVDVLGGIRCLGPKFLRKDRLGKQLIPFHRVGRTCLYDPDEVIEAIRAMRVGGKKSAKQSRQAA